MKRAYADSIAHVKQLYVGNKDVLHDITHSQRVAALAKDIAEHVGYEDLDLVELLAYWHDVARTQGIDKGHEEAGAKLAKEDLLSRGIDRKTMDVVYQAIRAHKHQGPVEAKSTEAKILKQADKLEIFSVVRWQRCAEAGWNDYYISEIHKSHDNIAKYYDAFTYEYTKRLFKKRLAEFRKYYDSVKDQL